MKSRSHCPQAYRWGPVLKTSALPHAGQRRFNEIDARKIFVTTSTLPLCAGYLRVSPTGRIVALLIILLGEALLFGDERVAAWAVLFWLFTFAVVVIYEEPTLGNGESGSILLPGAPFVALEQLRFGPVAGIVRSSMRHVVAPT